MQNTLLTRTIGYLYSVCYVPQAIRTSLQVLIALNPKDEYPEARAMNRHFILHIGGTNTGKTYAGFTAQGTRDWSLWFGVRRAHHA